MKKASYLSWFVAILVGMVLAFPPGLAAQSQSAGSIAREIPNVSLEHNRKAQLAAAGTKISWGDNVVTDQGGRARIVLDDGSILNVGSGSSLRIVQHDAASQKTSLQLSYGRLRASAVRLARPGASFEVRTPTAVAGVVGTGFDLSFINDISSLSVDEGSVNFCNLAGQCVTVGAGFTSAVRGSQSPSQPAPTSPSAATDNANSTSMGSGGGGGAVGTTATVATGVSHSVLIIATVIAGVVIPAAVIPATAGSQPHKCGCTTVP